MSVTRRTVLEELATASDADRGETTTVQTLAATLDTDEHVVEGHLVALASCELAHRSADGRVRVTVTGEELLGLDADDPVIVDPTAVNGN